MKVAGTMALVAALLLLGGAAAAQLPPECAWLDCSHLENDSGSEHNTGGSEQNNSDPDGELVEEANSHQTGPLALPEAASAQGHASSAHGLSTANVASNRGN